MTQEIIQPAIDTNVPAPFNGPVRSVKDLRLCADQIRYSQHRLDSIDNETSVVNARKIIEDANKRKTEIAMGLAEFKSGIDKSLISVLTRLFEKKAPNTKGKTYENEDFKVSLKMTSGALGIQDRERAIEWAKVNAPNAVVTKIDFNANLLTDEQREELLALSKKDAEKIGLSVRPSENKSYWSVK